MPQASERAKKLAGEVLAKISGYDPSFYKPSPAILQAWAEHISLRNPEPEDMLTAVAKFYETNTDAKPLPASISSLARQIRQERTMRSDYRPPRDKSADPEPPAPPGAQKITMAQWEERHQMRFPKLALGRSVDEPDEQLDAPNPLRVACPYCRASVGSPCTAGQVALSKSRAHESRRAVSENRCGGLHHVQPHTRGCELA